MMMQLQQQQHDMQQQLAAQRQETEQRLATQRAEFEVRLQSRTPEPMASSTSGGDPFTGSRQARHKQDHLNPFLGERTRYPGFRLKVQSKMAVDAAAIGNDTEQALYVLSKLEGVAEDRMGPWITAQNKMGVPITLLGLLEQMDITFSDPRAVQNTTMKLQGLKQGKQDFGGFLNDFDKLLLKAEGWSWPDAVKKSYLEPAIADALANEMVPVDESPTYLGYCSQLRAVWDRLQRRKDLRASKGGSHCDAASSNEAQRGEEMDWEPTKASRTASSNARSGFGTRATSNNAGSAAASTGIRAKWVSRQEIDRRFDAGACIRCGAEGHFTPDCTFLRSKRPARPAAPPRPAARPAPARAKKAHFEEEESEESGKE